jgi:hypothetical protein
MHRTPVATRLLLGGAATIALAVAVGGCSHAATVGSNRTLRVALTEYRVIPQSVKSKAGQVTLIVENDGRLTHDLAIWSGGRVITQTPPLLPGAVADLVLSLTPGTYMMASTLFSDQALGAYGTLTVVS